MVGRQGAPIYITRNSINNVLMNVRKATEVLNGLAK